MNAFDLGDLGKELANSENEEISVSFEDKQQTWNTPEDVREIVEALGAKKVVHSLKLEGNTLGVEAAAAIGKALEQHPKFRKALWRNMFTGRLKTEIPQALKHLGNGLIVANAQLVVLDLSDNALGPNGMVGLNDLLRSKVCYTLQELYLNNCGLGIGGGEMLSKALLDCFKESINAGRPLQLRKFVTGRNRLEDKGAQAIAKIFATLKTFEEIIMPQNSIYHAGIKSLAEGFAKNPNLKVLNLNDNTVTEVGAEHLARAFRNTPLLRDINFGDCLLKTNGAYYFAEAFADNHAEIEYVDLTCNEINSDGGLVLANTFSGKPNLKLLNINGNQFGPDGCARIKEIMYSFVKPNVLADLDDDEFDENDFEDYDGENSAVDDDDDDDDEDDDDDDEDGDDEDDNNKEIDDTGSENYPEDETAYATFNTVVVGNDSVTSNIKNLSTEQQKFEQEKKEEPEKQQEKKEEPEKEQKKEEQEKKDEQEKKEEQKKKDEQVKKEEQKQETSGNTANKTAAEKFCLSQLPCTLEMFNSIEYNKLESLKNVINKFKEDNYLIVLIFTTLKCANLSKSSTDALDVAKALYKETIDYAVKIKQERRVLNFILKQLGLLQSEEKFKIHYNSEGCRFALRETLNHETIASEYMKNCFDTFLNNLNI